MADAENLTFVKDLATGQELAEPIPSVLPSPASLGDVPKITRAVSFGATDAIPSTQDASSPANSEGTDEAGAEDDEGVLLKTTDDSVGCTLRASLTPSLRGVTWCCWWL